MASDVARLPSVDSNATKLCSMDSSVTKLCVVDSYVTRARIHEGPSRYQDHKANRPDSYGPLPCSEEAVFMKAGQQGPHANGPGIFKSRPSY